MFEFAKTFRRRIYPAVLVGRTAYAFGDMPNLAILFEHASRDRPNLQLWISSTQFRKLSTQPVAFAGGLLAPRLSTALLRIVKLVEPFLPAGRTLGEVIE